MEHNTFLLWLEDFEDIDKLSAAEAGKLFKAILKYASDQEPGALPTRADTMFGYIRRHIDRDRESYESKCSARSEAGKKGGKASGKVRKQKKANEANASFASKSEANEPEPLPLPLPEPQPLPEPSPRSLTGGEGSGSNIRTPAPSAAHLGESGIEIIVDMYNAQCPGLTPCKLLSDVTRFAIRERWKKYPDLSYFHSLFEAAQRSDLLTGRKTNWRADLDWLMQEKNFSRVINGSYDNAPGKQEIPTGASGQLGEAELESIRRILSQPVESLSDFEECAP